MLILKSLVTERSDLQKIKKRPKVCRLVNSHNSLTPRIPWNGKSKGHFEARREKLICLAKDCGYFFAEWPAKAVAKPREMRMPPLT
jgi:hypothetical protein